MKKTSYPPLSLRAVIDGVAISYSRPRFSRCTSFRSEWQRAGIVIPSVGVCPPFLSYRAEREARSRAYPPPLFIHAIHKIFIYSRLYERKKLWITFSLCGKERLFVDKNKHFSTFSLYFCEIYPQFCKFSKVIHKNTPFKKFYTQPKSQSYPQEIRPFCPHNRGKPLFSFLRRVVHRKVIHIFTKC